MKYTLLVGILIVIALPNCIEQETSHVETRVAIPVDTRVAIKIIYTCECPPKLIVPTLSESVLYRINVCEITAVD